MLSGLHSVSRLGKTWSPSCVGLDEKQLIVEAMIARMWIKIVI